MSTKRTLIAAIALIVAAVASTAFAVTRSPVPAGWGSTT